MGRHGKAAAKPAVPWGFIGWGGFSCLITAAALLWTGQSWSTSALVVGVGLLGLVLVALLTVYGSTRPGR